MSEADSVEIAIERLLKDHFPEQPPFDRLSLARKLHSLIIAEDEPASIKDLAEAYARGKDEGYSSGYDDAVEEMNE